MISKNSPTYRSAYSKNFLQNTIFVFVFYFQRNEPSQSGYEALILTETAHLIWGTPQIILKLPVVDFSMLVVTWGGLMLCFRGQQIVVVVTYICIISTVDTYYGGTYLFLKSSWFLMQPCKSWLWLIKW